MLGGVLETLEQLFLKLAGVTQTTMYRYTLFYTAASVHSTAKKLLLLTHASLAHRKNFQVCLVRGGFQLKCLC